MKILRHIGLSLLAAAVFAGCAKDDAVKVNTLAGATVGLESTEITLKENAGMERIPIVVDGEMDGVVNVAVEVEAQGSVAAEEDVHYLITDKTLTINPDDKEAAVEIILVDDDEINEARTFTIKITKADGAALNEGKSAAKVKIKDNDSNFYEKLAGKWSFKEAGGLAFDADLKAYPEDDKLFEKEFQLILHSAGIVGLDFVYTVKYAFDVKTKQISLETPSEEALGVGLNFPDGVYDAYTALVDLKTSKLSFDPIIWEVSDDFKTIRSSNVTGDLAMAGLLFETGTTNIAGLWYAFAEPTLTK